MANELLIKNINNGNVEKFIRQKGIINNLEIQKIYGRLSKIRNKLIHTVLL